MSNNNNNFSVDNNNFSVAFTFGCGSFVAHLRGGWHVTIETEVYGETVVFKTALLDKDYGRFAIETKAMRMLLAERCDRGQ